MINETLLRLRLLNRRRRTLVTLERSLNEMVETMKWAKEITKINNEMRRFNFMPELIYEDYNFGERQW